MTYFVKRFIFLLALLALSACAHTEVTRGFTDEIARVAPAGFTCCSEPEKFYPEPVIKTAKALADRIGPQVTEQMYGGYREEGFPGKLSGKTAAGAALMEQLQPLDLVFTGNKSYIWGKIIPGRFSHGVVYLGTEAQLRRAGLWDLAALAPLRDDIRAGRVFIEAVTPVVGTLSLDQLIQNDAAAILRPQLGDAARRQAFAALANNLGVPYDFSFEVATTDRLACTELINLAMPGLRFATQEAYGGRVILPDTVVAQAIRGERMRVVGYMVGTGSGFAWRNTHSLMADIAAYWGIPG
ncbi:MAG: YiiX/YebB-like N1pC/P60 family cysteine hydrolase [Paracoccaceae bacterium]